MHALITNFKKWHCNTAPLFLHVHALLTHVQEGQSLYDDVSILFMAIYLFIYLYYFTFYKIFIYYL